MDPFIQTAGPKPISFSMNVNPYLPEKIHPLSPTAWAMPTQTSETWQFMRLECGSFLRTWTPQRRLALMLSPAVSLRTSLKELAPVNSALYQQSFNCSKVPADWTDANVTPVYKKGDVHSASNYRPFSLTGVLSKVIEHILCTHILEHLESHNILMPLQHASPTHVSPAPAYHRWSYASPCRRMQGH